MANNATQIRVGVSGQLFMAVTATAAPTDIVTALPGAWKDLGYIDENGLSQSPDISTTDINAWQSQLPVRTMVTNRMLKWKFVLLERTRNAIELAFGGGTWGTAGTTPNIVTTYTPPVAGADVYERSFVLEVVDGALTDRYYLARAMVSSVSGIPEKKDDAVKFELELVTMAPASGSPWKWITNDQVVSA